MGVGLYSVSCGYGYGCGFGGLTSLIAMVLALRAREALRMGMGGKVFSGPSLRCGARSVRRSASRRLVIANGDQRPLAPKCRAALAAPCGHFASLVRSSSTARLPSENFVLLRRILRPVQHLRRPIPQLRLVQGRRNAALWASRFAISEVGHVGRVGQWFPEICFESFAQDLATPSARSFAMNQNRRMQCNRQGALHRI